jgi:cell division cycle protein 37
MLSLEERIIDATTEEGQKALKEFEDQERAVAAAASPSNPRLVDENGDPE